MRVFRYLLLGLLGLILLAVGFLVIPVLLRSNTTTYANEQLTMGNPLSVPPLLEPRSENGEKVFDLMIQSGETEFFAGQRTKTLGFNGTYLGPTLRAHTGDKVRVNIMNMLGEAATVHWHGMHLPAAMDGGPHQVIAVGGTWQPNWTIANEAATLWYHPHQMGKTGEQVYRGLAGAFLIDDANSDALALPKEYGVDDIPLVVQDRRFDSSGQFVYQGHEAGGLPPAAGMLGDTILVNGTRAPYVEVPAKLIRLRLVNGSNGRRYDFGFADNRAFQQIATDGGLLDQPVERTRLLLAPGERAEILVDLHDASGPLTLLSYPVVDNKSFVLNVVGGLFGDDDQHDQFKILELRPQAGPYPAQPIPQTLNRIQRLDPTAAVKTRTFGLDASTINNRSMDHARVDEIVKKGDIEIWQVRNESPMYHGFHVHGVQFQVLDRNGAPPPAYEQGWKDTIIVSPAETVRLIMQFTGYADPHLPYMFHCHILEHEDMGMMGQFVVVDNLSDPVSIQSPLTGMSGEQHTHP